MANIKNLTLGANLLKDSRVNTVSAFFGLSSKTIYVPTGSKITATVYEFPATKEDMLRKLLSLSGAALKDAVAQVVTLRSAEIGNLRLEVCLSADHKFVALQLLRYSNFVATPITGLTIYEGEDAAVLAGLL